MNFKQKIKSPKSKTIESQRQLKKVVKNTIEPMLMKEIERLINDVKLPENWMVEGNLSLCKFVLKNTLTNDLFDPKNENEKIEFETLKNQL